MIYLGLKVGMILQYDIQIRFKFGETDPFSNQSYADLYGFIILIADSWRPAFGTVRTGSPVQSVTRSWRVGSCGWMIIRFPLELPFGAKDIPSGYLT